MRALSLICRIFLPGILLVALAASAQDMLSPAEIDEAISGVGMKRWVRLTDNKLEFAAALSGGGDIAQEPSITIVMPEAVIAIKSAFAKKQFLPYQPDAEDSRRSLTIVAQGMSLSSPSGPACSSINRIALLSDHSGTARAEAYISNAADEAWQNGFGASSKCQSLRAKFALSDVRRIQEAAPHGEFLVAVFYVGVADPRIYKMKHAYLDKLGLR